MIAAVRRRHAVDLLGAEGLLVELDRLGAGIAHQVRNQVFMPGGNRLRGLAHVKLLKENVKPVN